MNGKVGFDFAGVHGAAWGSLEEGPVHRGGWGPTPYGVTECKKVKEKVDGHVYNVKGVFVPRLTAAGKRRQKCERDCIERHEAVHAADERLKKACDTYRHYEWMAKKVPPGDWKKDYAEKREAALAILRGTEGECEAWLDTLRCFRKMKCKYESAKFKHLAQKECRYVNPKIKDAAGKVKKYCKYSREQMEVLLDSLERDPG